MINTIIPKTMYAGMKKKPTKRTDFNQIGQSFNNIKAAIGAKVGKGKMQKSPGPLSKAMPKKMAAPKATPAKKGMTKAKAYFSASSNPKDMVRRRLSANKPLATGGVYSKKKK